MLDPAGDVVVPAAFAQRIRLYLRVPEGRANSGAPPDRSRGKSTSSLL
jgi:hypothetical protein